MNPMGFASYADIEALIQSPNFGAFKDGQSTTNTMELPPGVVNDPGLEFCVHVFF